MSETLRECIAGIVIDIADDRHAKTTAGDYTPLDTDAYVSHILATVREALLSPEAVEAGAATWWEYFDRSVARPRRWSERNADAQDHGRKMVTPILTAAIGAAFGEEASRE